MGNELAQCKKKEAQQEMDLLSEISSVQPYARTDSAGCETIMNKIVKVQCLCRSYLARGRLFRVISERKKNFKLKESAKYVPELYFLINLSEEAKKRVKQLGRIDDRTILDYPCPKIFKREAAILLENKPFRFYEGCWSLTGEFHGKGLLVQEGCLKEGIFIQGRLHGYGRAIWNDGSFYEGEWKRGMFHGFGKMEREGVKYRCNWVEGIMEGEGVAKYPDGRLFEGRFSKGVGVKGKLTCSNGTKYYGLFDQNMQLKEGKIKFECGDRFSGELQGEDGSGIYEWEDGSMFKGSFIKGKLEGEGKFKTRLFSFEGLFSEGCFEGKSTIEYEGSKYSVEFKDNQVENIEPSCSILKDILNATPPKQTAFNRIERKLTGILRRTSAETFKEESSSSSKRNLSLDVTFDYQPSFERKSIFKAKHRFSPSLDKDGTEDTYLSELSHRASTQKASTHRASKSRRKSKFA